MANEKRTSLLASSLALDFLIKAFCTSVLKRASLYFQKTNYVFAFRCFNIVLITRGVILKMLSRKQKIIQLHLNLSAVH